MSAQQKITNMQDALHALEVDDNILTAEEKKELDEQGYAIFHDFIEPEWLEQLRETYEMLMKKEGDDAGKEFRQEAGTRRLSDLINKGEVFDGIYTHPKILAVTHYVIGRDFKVNSINGRDALPGQGHQALHADWGTRKEGEGNHIVNTLWLLDDFTPDNGATRVVPTNHKLFGKPSDYVEDLSAPHPDEKLIIAKAGTVVAYNAHMWHGGTENRTSQTRRVLHPSFIAREFPQQYNQRELLRKTTYDRISPAARYLLDVE
ncbi:phytanoyl-CoA dioxygenase family protein [Paenibacillus xerothermodurans]|uniref:Phytanoyl-CoA dioxygenase n=1 Tax=Paenibacillus xerothermodurans TaxID=1977292 RepID=A0A2W1NF38_PAEXE|nr:phytanoyl-CoA dioxygenase family protein [Paenibacillus xerothermodurans]PZE22290.1 phytanoyl-CoA dioxygenase [Paenibacillus xerothermodurans]